MKSEFNPIDSRNPVRVKMYQDILGKTQQVLAALYCPKCLNPPYPSDPCGVCLRREEAATAITKLLQSVNGVPDARF